MHSNKVADFTKLKKKKNHFCYRLNSVSLKIICRIPNPPGLKNVTGFGDRVL